MHFRLQAHCLYRLLEQLESDDLPRSLQLQQPHVVRMESRPPNVEGQGEISQRALLVNSLRRRLAGRSLPTFTYRDHGSLISLGHYETVGNLMGRLVGRSVKIQGFLARLLYLSLYRHHQLALHGFLRMALDALAQWLRQRTSPRVKLH